MDTTPFGLTDDMVLSFTQGTRKKFIAHLLANGFPEDTKEQHILLTSLADMDRVALGNKRIGVNEKQAAADVLVAKAIAQISAQYGQVNPFEGQTQAFEPVYDLTRLPAPQPAPGETDIGLCEGNYKTLMELYD